MLFKKYFLHKREGRLRERVLEVRKNKKIMEQKKKYKISVNYLSNY